MAMTALNNTAAMLTLGQLNKNVNKAGKDLRKVATGQKINSAGDAASEYAISEKMRAQIRALDQDIQNVQNGASLLKVAAGGIDNIVDELRTMKEIALNAANDHNTDKDRIMLQREFDERRANIDAIAVETEYNGKKLLDGRWHNAYNTATTTAETTAETITTTEVIEKPAVVAKTIVPPTTEQYGWPHPYKLVSTGVAEPTGTATYTKNGNDVTITSNGVYTLSDNENIQMADGVTDVKFQSNGNEVSQVYITGPAGGKANFWLENVNVKNYYGNNFIKFQGSGNVLNMKGENKFYQECNGSNKAIINIGGGLTVEGGTDGTGSFDSEGYGIEGAVIGTDANENSTATVTVNSGNYISNTPRNGAPFLGAGWGADSASIGEIVVNGGVFTDINANQYVDCLIGSGSNKSTVLNKITVRNAVVISRNTKEADPVIGRSSLQDDTQFDIYVENSYVYWRGNSGAGIGNYYYRDPSGDCGNIEIVDSYLDLRSESGAGVGSAQNSTVGNITITNCDISNVKSVRGDDIGKGVNGSCGVVTVTGTGTPTTDVSGTGTDEGGTTTETVTVTRTVSHTEYNTQTAHIPDNPLHIHHGTRANQSMTVHIRDMRANALKTDTLSADDEKELARLAGGDAEKLRKILDAAQDKSIADADVTTRDNALVAIRLADGAIDYALDEATTVGSYVSRLEYMEQNLVNANENTQASESSVRDADMAKAMTSYTKNNVLLQASQSMLAQANQNASGVLGLLQ